MTLLLMQGLPDFRFIDIIDILLSGLLFYSVYKLIKGTNAISIFVGFFLIYIIWKIVRVLEMRLLSEIIGQFISVGVIALIIIFQPEIRRFLLLLGTKSIRKSAKKRFFFWRVTSNDSNYLDTTAIVQAYGHLSSSKTGALIVLSKENELDATIYSGEIFECDVNSQVIETIFFKNTPLHDGALIIKDNKIKSARCILPVSQNREIPASLGLRHRSAIGITEQTDAVSIIVSEQTGKISISKEGKIETNISLSRLQEFLDEEFNS